MTLLDTRSNLDNLNFPLRHARAIFRSIVASIVARLRATVTRKVLAELSPEQRRDIGHEAEPGPQLVVKAGLVTNLMSMR